MFWLFILAFYIVYNLRMNSEFKNVRKEVLKRLSFFKSWSNLSIQQAEAQEGASWVSDVILARSTWNNYRLKNGAYSGGKFAFPCIKAEKQQTYKTVTPNRDGHSRSFVQPDFQKR